MLTRESWIRTRALAAAAITFLTVSAAQASVWYGSWDPLFGPPYSDTTPPPTAGTLGYDLGWGGEIKVNDDACAVVPGDTISNSTDCGGGGAIVVTGSLFVRLYEYPNLTPVYNTLVFNAASLVIDQLRYDSNGKLTGISTTGLSDWVADGSSGPPVDAGTGAEFAIYFVLDGEPCFLCGAAPNFADLPSDYDGPVLFAREATGTICRPGDGGGEICITTYDYYRSDVESYPALVNFTPEPGTLALFVASLLAAASAPRRRASSGSEPRPA